MRLTVFSGSEEEAAGKLHGECRTSLGVALVGHINPGHLRHADEIHPAVLEEAPVLDGQHGIHHDFGDLVVFHHLALGTLFGVEQRGNHLRFQLVSGQLSALSRDVSYLAILYANRRGFRAVIGLGARLDLDSAADHAVAAHGRLLIFVGVARPAQFRCNLPSIDLFAHMNGLRYGVDFRGIAENLALEAGVNNAIVPHVVVGKNHRRDGGQHQEDNGSGLYQRVPQKA